MRLFTALFCFLCLVVTGCGSHNSGDSHIVTFSNGVSFDRHVNQKPECTKLEVTPWFFGTEGTLRFRGKLNSDGKFFHQTISASDKVICGIPVEAFSFANEDGTSVVTRYLARSTDNSIYMLGLQGAGADDFEISSLNSAPVLFLPNVVVYNGSWSGGFYGHDAMYVNSTSVINHEGLYDTIVVRVTHPDGTVAYWYFTPDFGITEIDDLSHDSAYSLVVPAAG